MIKAATRPQFAPIAIPIEVDGQELQAIVDTGAHDIGLPTALLEQLDYPSSERLRSRGAMTGGLLGAGGQDLLVRVKNLKVGTEAMERYPTFSVKSDKALLGFRFLSQFVVTIDYPAETVALQRSDEATFPHNVFHTGMALSKEQNGSVVVTGLWEGAPADRLGIRVGNSVDRIGQKLASEYTQTELSNLSTDPTCKEITLEIRDSQGTREVRLVKSNLFPEAD